MAYNMSLEQVRAEIAKVLGALASTPSNMTTAQLDRLATLAGRREALWVMEGLPLDVQAQAAMDNIASLTKNSANCRGAEVAALLGQLEVFGAFLPKKPE